MPVVTIQGDHQDTLIAELKNRGFKCGVKSSLVIKLD
jgi:translation initiation factor 1 (eIF-1/SUI1)